MGIIEDIMHLDGIRWDQHTFNPTLQGNVTLFAVDSDDEIQEIEHQLSTDNCETSDSEDKPEDTTTIDWDHIEEDT